MVHWRAVKKVSRRRFLKGFASGPIALGLSGLVGSRLGRPHAVAYAQPTATAPSRAGASVVRVEPNEVRVGAPYPLTGSWALGAWQIVEGIRMAADIVNNEYPDYDTIPFAATTGLPNHDGAQVRLIILDSQGLAETALADTERLITQDQVQVVFGGYASSLSAVVSETAERYGIPYVCGAASSPTLGERGLKWYFRQQPHDIVFTDSMFRFLEDSREKYGIEVNTLGILHEDTLFGSDSAEQMRLHAEKYGYEVVVDLQYSRESLSLVSEVERLKAANPDCVMPTAYVADAILFVKTCKELDYSPPMVVAQDAGYTDPNFTGDIAVDAEGYVTRAAWAPDSKREIVQQVKALFNERTGKDVSEPGAKGIQSFLTLVDALNRAESFSPEDIRQALLETDISMENSILPFGVSFDPETGENTLTRAVMWQMHEGNYRTVWPFEEAIADVLYPIPPWSER